MPEKEPNKYPRHTAVREVMILPLSTNSIWIRADDIPWMIQYVADEIGPSGSQCVPAIGLEDDETNAPNCKADGVCITWDFEDWWTATSTMGPLEGQVLRCRVSTFTKDNCSRLLKHAVMAFRSRRPPWSSESKQRMTFSKTFASSVC